ncbi:Rne/Rng family ribonuclease [Moraxella bovoculi]|uniref:Rne/Rng family ribonuclease n=1 Tax=Moraxella bovoculi TaxID=386891 RepID=UPI0006245B61|nr:Rne/Rng family ribonuclease [Moraxella bovoculi]AKG16178.2 ribonuclease E [Moraxella bovoculi]
MKRILINATHNEEIRVALCKDNHLYDFDLENRTREQKKANIYKGHITRVEPSLEAAFVEYGSARQGFLPLREIAPEYLHGNLREDSIKQLLKEGDEVIVQVEKEERGNKGAALSTYISLAGRYLVLMPNNSKAGGISRQISGKVREEMKQIIASLSIPKGMSVIVRTAGLGKGFEDLQNDLNHLLDIWTSILDQNKKRPSPCLVHQEAGVVTRAVRDYLRDDISEVWIDSENAYNEAANFIAAVMPAQLDKLRKYTEYEPMFARFGIERQIETAYQREVRLPSGGSIVIDQTEALVSIDINSSKSTKGSDVSETAYHTNLEAADEIARQLRLRDMGGLIVIDFIDMADARHQKDVEKRLIEATRHDRARVQFAEISKFGLMEMSRQRLRPSLEEATGYICPRCHGNGMIRDLRSLALSIMRQIEQIALKERMGEIQAEVPTEIAAFLLNEKRESLVYLEQDSGTRITVLPHAHLESPNFSLHFNPDGFAPSSYERIVNAEEEEMGDRGYDVNWQTQNEHAEQDSNSRWQKASSSDKQDKPVAKPAAKQATPEAKPEPQVAAWLSNLFAPKPQAQLAGNLNNNNAAAAIESIVNAGGISLGASGIANLVIPSEDKKDVNKEHRPARERSEREPREEVQERRQRNRKSAKKDATVTEEIKNDKTDKKPKKEEPIYPKRESGSRREPRGEVVRGETLTPSNTADKADKKDERPAKKADKQRTRPSNPNEVLVNVAPIAKETKQSETIHLSLDGSKPLSTKQPNNQPAKTEEAPIADTSVETNIATDVIEPAATDNSIKITKQTKEQIAETQVTTEQADVRDNDTPSIDNTRLTELARQMNKAVNDPRVVIAANSAPSAIFGTAGDFIANVLGDSKGDNFVQNFIQAVAKYRAPVAEFSFANYGYAPLNDSYLAEFDKQTSVASRISAPQGKSEAPAPRIARRAANDPRGQHPDFKDEADEEASATDGQASSQDEALDLVDISIAQEKKAAIAQPADVDQQTDTSTDVDTSVEAQDIAPSDTAPDNTDNSDEIAEQDKASPKAGPAETVKAEPVDDSVETEDAETSKSVDSETLLEQVKENVEVAVQTISDKVAELLETEDESSSEDEVEAPSKNEPTKKSKTSANSYKDMIENVAGQLLPQVGILNLAQPKPAKTRIRKTATKGDNKPKSEVRKAGSKVAAAKSDSDQKPE